MSAALASMPKAETAYNKKIFEKTILCDQAKSQLIKIGFGRITILNFSFTPKEVLPGEHVFDFKQIKNDLAIKALRPQARTNVAIYLNDRRCSFELITVIGRGDDILFVRDAKDTSVEVKIHD